MGLKQVSGPVEKCPECHVDLVKFSPDFADFLVKLAGRKSIWSFKCPKCGRVFEVQ
jgi:ssDNA-binding Zn-finger/Zn-ribbon topoisomerase 1